MPLEIGTGVVIADRDLSVAFVRASGPGGQNVNKVATAAQLRFDLAGTSALSEPQKQRARALAGHRLTEEGAILIIARNHRTQERNRAEALERLRELLGRALIEPRLRRATKPTRAAREARLARKAHTQQRKRLRGRVGWED
jgi:ribosome-associated protein